MSPETAERLAAQAREKVQPWIGEAYANQDRSLRRARYWITALRVFGKISQMRQYIDGIRRYDAEFLSGDPQIGEAIGNMRALARELNLLAAALAEQQSAKGMNGHERSTAA
jgi:hypothetical protein